MFIFTITTKFFITIIIMFITSIFIISVSETASSHNTWMGVAF